MMKAKSRPVLIAGTAYSSVRAADAHQGVHAGWQ